MRRTFFPILLLILSILFFHDLFSDRYILSERDLAPYFIPQRYFWVESIKRGDFPLWNPYQYMGQPFFANPQNAILYPINSLFFILPFDIAFNSIIILHFFLGGLFVYVLLRDMNISYKGSIISGLIFMLSGYLLSVHSLLPILISVIWTPLIVMFFRKVIDNPTIRNEILVSIFITLSFFGGGVEVIYGNFFILIFLIFSKFKSQNRFKEFILRLKSLFIIIFLSFLLSSIQLIPFIELWIHSIRESGISYEEATIWSLAPKDFLLFFLPDAYGYFLDMKKYWTTQCWIKTLYTGGLPFILSIIFFILPDSSYFKKDKKIYIFLMIFSIFLSLGRYNPLYLYFYNFLPFFNGIRYPVKFLYVFVLYLSITAGLGFEKLLQFSKNENKKVYKNLFLIFSIISGAILLGFVIGHKEIELFLKTNGIDFPNFNHTSVNLFHIKRFLFYLTVFFLILRIGIEFKWNIWTASFLIIFLIGDLFGNIGFYGKEKTEDYFRKTKIIEIISKNIGPYRVFSTPKTISFDTPVLIDNPSPLEILKEKHIPSFNLLYKIPEVWGIDVIRLRRLDELYKLWSSTPSLSESNLIDLFGVKYIISVNPLEKDSHFELIYARLDGMQAEREKLLKSNTIKLYKYNDGLPRAFIVKDFKIMNSKEIIYKLIDKGFKPKDYVFLEEDPQYPVSKSYGEVEFLNETNNRLRLKVKADGNCILFLSDTFFPGWKVFVNNKREKIFRANYNFRAVFLQKGIHNVEFVYDPMSFKFGTILTIFGIFISIIGIWFKRKI